MRDIHLDIIGGIYNKHVLQSVYAFTPIYQDMSFKITLALQIHQHRNNPGSKAFTVRTVPSHEAAITHKSNNVFFNIYVSVTKHEM